MFYMKLITLLSAIFLSVVAHAEEPAFFCPSENSFEVTQTRSETRRTGRIVYYYKITARDEAGNVYSSHIDYSFDVPFLNLTAKNTKFNRVFINRYGVASCAYRVEAQYRPPFYIDAQPGRVMPHPDYHQHYWQSDIGANSGYDCISRNRLNCGMTRYR